MNSLHKEQTEKVKLLSKLMEDVSLSKNFQHDSHIKKFWRNGTIQEATTWPTSRENNGVVEWFSHENKEKINPEYANIRVLQTMDEHGYRIYPNYIPTSNKSVYCFGCSETFGFSALDEETWPYLLAKKLGNWKVKNYGICGGSFECITSTCMQVIESLKKEEYPDAIYFLFPDPLRTRYIGNVENVYGKDHLGYKHTILGTYKDKTDALIREDIKTEKYSIKGKSYVYYNYTSAAHSFFEAVQHFKFLEEILASTGIQWYWYVWPLGYAKFSKDEILKYFNGNTMFDGDSLKIIPRNNEIPRIKARDDVHGGLGYTDPLTDELVKLYKS